MSSEARVVRPYAGVGLIQRALDDARLLWGDASLDPNGRLSLRTIEYLAGQVRLELCPTGRFGTFLGQILDGLRTAGIDPGQADLCAVATTPRLRLTDVVWRRPVARLQDGDRLVSLSNGDDRSTAFRAPHGGCEIGLYVLLATELEPRPLRPSRRGTWLGRVRFRVVTELGEIGSTPIPLTDDLRRNYELPDDALRYVRVESPLDPDAGPHSLEVYVDETILAQLTASPHTPGAKSFQRQLMLDSCRVVISMAQRELAAGADPSADELDGSLIGNVIRLVVGGGSQAGEHAQQWIRMLRTNPEASERLMAYVEHAVEHLRSDLSKVIQEGT